MSTDLRPSKTMHVLKTMSELAAFANDRFPKRD
jgi:hypothetical protein